MIIYGVTATKRWEKGNYFDGVVAARNGVKGGNFDGVAAVRNGIKECVFFSIAAATDLFKEFSSDAGSYRRMTLVGRPDNDHRSLGSSLHILFLKKWIKCKRKR